MNALSQSPIRYRAAGPIVVGAFVLLTLISNQLPDYLLELGVRFFLLVTMAEAWNLMAGYAGLVSLGTASFFGIGAYVLVGAVNAVGAPLLIAVPAGGLAAGTLALLLSPAVFRLRGLYFTVGTLALAEALRLFMVNNSAFGGAAGLFLGGDAPTARVLFLAALSLLAIATAVVTLATESRVSILLRAVRDNEDAAAQVGVRAFRVKLAAFVTASVLTGMSGALQAVKLGAVEPYGTFGVGWTVSVLSVVVIGGLGRRAAPLVGALFLLALGEWLADFPAVHLALTGVILLVVIRFAPQGLVGLGAAAWQRLRASWQ